MGVFLSKTAIHSWRFGLFMSIITLQAILAPERGKEQGKWRKPGFCFGKVL
jgi:hypothetical protein